ncbi:MAG: hypothetical protein KF778_06685 [Rhodocyclaceae bacterium]|nr:hypothetical protein [Rhodocyclaceae bacterium]MBX3668073.1 hypothetical protein [Rhodocyclaceae bacterium]
MKTVAIVISAGLLLYAFLFWQSVQRIDNFCASVDETTQVGELQRLADLAGVDLRGPRVITASSGETYVFAIAASGFTVGEYACRVRANSMSGAVSQKRVGY